MGATSGLQVRAHHEEHRPLMSDDSTPGSFEPPHDPESPNRSSVPPAPASNPPTEPPAAGGEPPFAPPAAGGSSIADAATAPAPTAEQAAPSWKAWVAAGAVAAVVAFGAAVVLGGGSDDSSTNASTPAANTAGGNAAGYGGQFPGGGNFRGMGTSGEVTANEDGTLTVQGQDDTETTVKTTDETVVTKTSEGELSDLEVGDNVLVVGEADGDAVAATAITDNGDRELTAGFAGGGRPGGSADGTAPDGSVPDGQTPPNGGTFPEGQTPPDGAMPDGQTPPDGGQGFPGGQGGMPTFGEITKIDGGTITVKTADGETVTVTTSDDTTVSVSEEISVSDIAVGDTITAQGETADDVVTATTIRVGELGQGFPWGGGFPGGGPGGGQGQGGPNGATPDGSSSGDTTTVTGT